jgi:hypothetical protein
MIGFLNSVVLHSLHRDLILGILWRNAIFIIMHICSRGRVYDE